MPSLGQQGPDWVIVPKDPGTFPEKVRKEAVKCNTHDMSDSKTDDQYLGLAQAVNSPKWRPIIFLVNVCIIAGIYQFIYGVPRSTLWISYAVLLSCGGAIAITVPPDDLNRILHRRTNLLGVLAFLIANNVIRYAYSGAGNEAFYEVCAATLPILILALIIDSHVLETENHLFWIFINLTLIAGGEGGSLLAIVDGSPNHVLFSVVSAAMISTFVTVIASAVTKAKGSLSTSTRFVLFVRRIDPSMMDKSNAIKSPETNSE